jgi:hypothetical protein
VTGSAPAVTVMTVLDEQPAARSSTTASNALSAMIPDRLSRKLVPRVD